MFPILKYRQRVRIWMLFVKFFILIMDTINISRENMDEINLHCVESMAKYFQVMRLPPKIQHNRINSNQIFRDEIVEKDVFQSMRFLNVRPN